MMNKTKHHLIIFALLCSLLFSGCSNTNTGVSESDAVELVKELGYAQHEYITDFHYPTEIVFQYHCYGNMEGYIRRIDEVNVIYPIVNERISEPYIETEYYSTDWSGIVGTWEYTDDKRSFYVLITSVDEDTITLSYELNGIESYTGILSTEPSNVQSGGSITEDFGWHSDTARHVGINNTEGIWVYAKDGVTIDGYWLTKID